MPERDDDLEAAIDSVGRERVLARAAFYGFDTPNDPPKWVWWAIVRELKEIDAGRPDPTLN